MAWFLPTYLQGKDFERIQKLCKRIDANPPADQPARQKFEDEIYHTMIDIVFHPNWRARSVWYGVKLPHFKDFSHIYESAVFAYYKREYPACILLLLCALEGILRSFTSKSSFPKLIESVRNAPARNIPEAHRMYSATLADFLETWLYKDTRRGDADFTLSVLNRHYVMHGLDYGEFYRPQDVHRLMLAFDLLIDFLGVDSGIYDSVFLPDPGRDAFFDRRRDYFHSRSEGDFTVKQTWRMERSLLKDHPRYVEPRLPEPDAFQSQLITTLDMLGMMSRAGKLPSQSPTENYVG